MEKCTVLIVFPLMVYVCYVYVNTVRLAVLLSISIEDYFSWLCMNCNCFVIAFFSKYLLILQDNFFSLNNGEYFTIPLKLFNLK